MLFKNMIQKSLKNQSAYRSYVMIGLVLLIINASAQEPVIQELITNGDFEQGNWDGWEKHTVTDFESGFFLSTPGTEPPISQKSGSIPPRLTANNATGGNYYMVTDQTGPGKNAILQTFTVPEGTTQVTLQFQLFVNSYYCDPSDSLVCRPKALINPSGLNYLATDNQHARVDILRADTYPFDTSAVLRNLYIGVDFGRNPHKYTSYSFDITDTDRKSVV